MLIMNFCLVAARDSIFSKCSAIHIPLPETGQSYSLVLGGKLDNDNLQCTLLSFVRPLL